MKDAVFHFDTLAIIRGFPEAERGKIGSALGVVQRGETPTNAKKLKGFKGVYQISVKGPDNTYRVIYAFVHDDKVDVISAFVKKSKTGIKTPKSEIDKIKERASKLRKHQ
tara:strand:+ start:83 stop:412 length:330 start_codon:yes stop_codon:yes gene_type:complete